MAHKAHALVEHTIMHAKQPCACWIPAPAPPAPSHLPRQVHVAQQVREDPVAILHAAVEEGFFVLSRHSIVVAAAGSTHLDSLCHAARVGGGRARTAAVSRPACPHMCVQPSRSELARIKPILNRATLASGLVALLAALLGRPRVCGLWGQSPRGSGRTV